MLISAPPYRESSVRSDHIEEVPSFLASVSSIFIKHQGDHDTATRGRLHPQPFDRVEQTGSFEWFRGRCTLSCNGRLGGIEKSCPASRSRSAYQEILTWSGVRKTSSRAARCARTNNCRILQRDFASAQCVNDGGGPVHCVQFACSALHVCMSGALTDIEDHADLPIGFPGRRPQHDLPLAWR